MSEEAASMVSVPPCSLPPPEPLSFDPPPPPPHDTRPSSIRKMQASATGLDRIELIANPLVSETLRATPRAFWSMASILGNDRALVFVQRAHKCGSWRSDGIPKRFTCRGGSQTALAAPPATHGYSKNWLTCSQGCAWPRWVASCSCGKVCPKGNGKNGGRT